MDTVILAAGENVRLQAAGIPPGKKPLLYRDGEVLVRRLCRQAREHAGGQLTIVVSPRNAEDIAFATDPYNPRMVVQTTAYGPTHALDLALDLRAMSSNGVLLLMADNYIKEWPFPGQLTSADWPKLSVVASNDPALHPIDGEGFFTDDRDSLIRWLGPLTFHRDMYTPESKSWLEAFDNIAFDLHTVLPGQVEDMGVPS